MYTVIFDANIWIKYARAKDLAPLFDRMLKYDLVPIVNNYQLSEIFDAVIINKWMTIKQANQLIESIKKLV